MKTLKLFVILLITSLWACNATQEEKAYGPATQELVSLLENDVELKALVAKSIEQASKINPDGNTNPVQSFDEYYEFVNWAETAMPWALIKKEAYPNMFDDIFYGLCAFYFIIDQPLEELEDQGLVNNSLQYYEPFAKWLITFSKSWGNYLDTEDSWNDTYYQMALDDGNFGLQYDWYEDPANWKTFNEFFSRYLSSPDQRPIASPDNDAVVAAFADSQPQGVWAIDENSELVANGKAVLVKSAQLKSIQTLIGMDSEYKDAFANGTFTHSFLNVNDYHRYHFPMSGTIKEVRIIQGINPTGGSMNYDKASQQYVFDPSAKTGWQSIETRGCVILETEDYGLVALLPIGMVAVGSVNFEAEVVTGAQIRKGDMLGNFAFGGSDFIMVFQDGVNFELTAPTGEDGGYLHMLMGEELGRLSRR